MPIDMSKLIDDMGTWAAGRMSVYEEAAKASAQKMVDNTYSGADLTNDIAGALSRAADDFTSLLAVFVDNTDPK